MEKAEVPKPTVQLEFQGGGTRVYGRVMQELRGGLAGTDGIGGGLVRPCGSVKPLTPQGLSCSVTTSVPRFHLRLALGFIVTLSG